MMLPLDCIELKQIDTILLCGICYEYMETTVITPCSHNYCSLCIRKYLHYKTQCPACFEEVFERDLRVNKALDDIKEYFLKLKEKLSKYVQNVVINKLNTKDCTPLRSQHCKKSPITEKHGSIDNSNVIYDEAQQHITGASDKIEHALQDADVTFSSPSTSKTSKVSSFFTPKNKKILQAVTNENVVMCPVCKVNVSEKNINRHLDDCLKREVTKDKPVKPKPKRKPLPKLVVSLMKEAEIKKKLKELGLSCVGDRKTLELRLQRYTTLYNAECDKENPRSISELIKQCDEEENVEKKVNKLTFPRLQINRNTAENIIEEERRKYLEINKNSFESLISKIKSTEKVQKPLARRSILNEADSPELGNVQPTNSENLDLEDSDSSLACPLQMYSSEDPMSFVAVELSPSSNDKDESIIYAVDKEEAAIENTGFFHTEMRKTNAANKRSILYTEKPSTSSIFAGSKKSCVERNYPKKIESAPSLSNSTSLEKKDRLERDDDFSTTLLEDNAFDLSSNDSIIYNSDSEILASNVHDIIKDTTIIENLYMKSNVEKENIKSFKKRCLDNSMSEETNSFKKRQIMKVQTNCLSEQNLVGFNENQSNAFLKSPEKKSAKKSCKRKEEKFASSVCTPSRKSSRIRSKNNQSILNDTIL